MISQSIGSTGDSSSGYFVYQPFWLSRDAQIDLEKSEALTPIFLKKIKLEKVDYHHNTYTASLVPYTNFDEAKEQQSILQRSLLYISLRKCIGVYAPKYSDGVYYFDTPKKRENCDLKFFQNNNWTHLDGVYDAKQPQIIDDTKRLLKTNVGSISAITLLTAPQLENQIFTQVDNSKFNRFFYDNKNFTATELYASVGFEESAKAKLLLLISSLESLLPKNQKVNQSKKTAINIAVKAIQLHKKTHFEKNSQEWKDFDHAASLIGKLKNASISQKLKTFIEPITSELSEHGSPEEISRFIDQCYDARSLLLHTGESGQHPINSSLINNLSSLVSKVIMLSLNSKDQI